MASKDILLITNMNGDIVFSDGPVYRLGPREVLGRNFFKDIVTPYSKYKLTQLFGNQIFNHSDNLQFLFSTYNMRKNKQQLQPNVFFKYFKAFKARCSIIQCYFEVGSQSIVDIVSQPLGNQNQRMVLIEIDRCDYQLNQYKFFESDPKLSTIFNRTNSKKLNKSKQQENQQPLGASNYQQNLDYQ